MPLPILDGLIEVILHGVNVGWTHWRPFHALSTLGWFCNQVRKNDECKKNDEIHFVVYCENKSLLVQ